MLFHLGNVEQLIQDDSKVAFPQMISTERPDKAANHLLEGRVEILVNGSPYSLIVPGVFIDFLSSPEDLNLKHQYANLLKTIPNPIGPTIRNYWCINFGRCCCKCKFS